MISKAIYPGTFDPIHLGHVDVARRAARLFDQLIVAVAIGEGVKAPLFSFDDRVEMARLSLGEIPNIAVEGYRGLTVDYARRVGAVAMVRGVRTSADFDVEFPLAHMNAALDPEIETVLLPTKPVFAFISATLLKQAVSGGADPSAFVTEPVAEALRRRFGVP